MMTMRGGGKTFKPVRCPTALRGDRSHTNNFYIHMLHDLSRVAPALFQKWGNFAFEEGVIGLSSKNDTSLKTNPDVSVVWLTFNMHMLR